MVKIRVKAPMLILRGWQVLVGLLSQELLTMLIWRHARNSKPRWRVFLYTVFLTLVQRWALIGRNSLRNFCCTRLCKHALKHAVWTWKETEGGRANLFIPHIWEILRTRLYWNVSFFCDTIFFFENNFRLHKYVFSGHWIIHTVCGWRILPLWVEWHTYVLLPFQNFWDFKYTCDSSRSCPNIKTTHDDNSSS